MLLVTCYYKCMKLQTAQIRNVFLLYTFLLIVWGFYRVLFKLPEVIEEVILKPLIWLLPLFYFLAREKQGLSSLGWTTNNLFKGVYLGLGAGIVFGLVAILSNYAKYGSLVFSPEILAGQGLVGALGLSFITAISEETVFRGYIFGRLSDFLKDSFTANMISTLGWGIIHLPVLIFVYDLGFADIFVRFTLSCLFGFGSALVFTKTRNITSSVILNVMWTWPIILFR